MNLVNAVDESPWPFHNVSSLYLDTKNVDEMDNSPKWARGSGRMHPVLPCFDFAVNDFAGSKHFARGIARVRARNDKDLFLITMKEILFPLSVKSALAYLDKGGWGTVSGIEEKGDALRYYSAGIACGFVLEDMVERWRIFHLNSVRKDDAEDQLFGWLSDLKALIAVTIETIHWLDSMTDRNSETPLWLIWRGAIFWKIQHILYIASDLKLFVHSYELAFRTCVAGLLAWQAGWTHSCQGTEVRDAVFSIIYSTGTLVFG